MVENDLKGLNDFNQERKCPSCKKPVRGRVDKRFCSTPCRNAWHNEERKNRERIIRDTNKRLKRNWQVLRKLNSSGKTKVDKLQLIAKNFDFDLFTSMITNRDGRTYYFCYDQGFLKLDGENYLLVRRR